MMERNWAKRPQWYRWDPKPDGLPDTDAGVPRCSRRITLGCPLKDILRRWAAV